MRTILKPILRMPSFRSLLALLAVVASVSAPLAHAQDGTLRGRVLSEDGSAIAGARVQAVVPAGGSRTALTDQSGVFAIGSLPDAELRVTASAFGFGEATRTVRPGATEAEITFMLRPAAVRIEGIEVVSLRTSVPVSAVPGAVSVVGRAELAQQATLSSNLGDMLAQVVPGLGAGMQTPSLHGQSLRGRSISVLIDGVPQSTSRNVMRDLTTIDPSMIERVEVLRGATALYGDGATGGVINIVTRAPAGGRPRLTTSVLGESAGNEWEGGFGGRLSQSVTGAARGVDYVLSGSVSTVGRYYDAEGDMIPSDPHGQGGNAETRSHDLFAKIGFGSGARRLQLTANRFSSLQETDNVSDPALNRTEAYTAKARPLFGLEGAEAQGSDNTVVSVDYFDGELFGSRLHAQAYHRDYRTVFVPFDARNVATRRAVMQSWLDSERTGGRVDLESALPVRGATLLWGADYSRETTSQPVHIFDPAVYASSGGMVFQKTGEKIWVPVIRPITLGLFTQLAWTPAAWVQLRGGVRHERATMDVPDFTTLIGNEVEGGELRFDPTLYNVGAVLSSARGVSLYASFSQGFSLADIGLALRDAPAGAVLGRKEMEAQRVDQYEIGARGEWSVLEATLSAFRTSSELGTTSSGYNQPVVRAPERVYGVEGTLDVRAFRTVALGGTVSWTEGESFVARDSAWHALNSFRIQPLKATGYVEHRTLPSWTNRLQLLYSGSRDRAYDDRPNPAVIGFGERPVESYWVADLVSGLELGAGRFDIGVQNLLNRQYYSVVSQLLRSGGNSSYAAGRGRTLTLGYTISY